jgi:hypothetical protein
VEDFAVDEVISGRFSGALVEYGSLKFSYLERLDRGGGQPRISECPQNFLVVVRGYLRGMRAENRFKNYFYLKYDSLVDVDCLSVANVMFAIPKCLTRI